MNYAYVQGHKKVFLVAKTMSRCCAVHQQVWYMCYNSTQYGKVPQKHLEIAQVPMAHLPVMSKGNRWALTASCLKTSYVFAVPVKEKLAENVNQVYLLGILAHKGGCVAILSDSRTELKIKLLMKHVINFEFRGYFSMHNSLKWILAKFLESRNLEWDALLPFACYCYNMFPSSNGTESPFFPMFGWNPAEGWLTHLNNGSRYYGNNKGK